MTAQAEGARAGRGGWLTPLLLVLAFLALNITLNVANPIWEAIDEPGHFQYVKYVVDHHTLPPFGKPLPSLAPPGPGCEAKNCVARGDVSTEEPLYYILAAPFVAAIDLSSHVSWVANPYFTWPGYPLRDGVAIHTLTEAWPYQGMVLGVHVMRLVSGLMGAAAVLATYFAGLALSGRRSFALLAGAVTALTPGFLLTTSSVTNDNAAILTVSLGLLAGVQLLRSRFKSRAWLAVYAVMTVAGYFAKGTAIVLIPLGIVLLAMALLQRLPKADPVSLAWATPALAGLVFLGLVPGQRTHALDALRQVPQTLALSVNRWPGCNCPRPLQPLWGGLLNVFETYWGSFGWETFHLPPPFYRPFLAAFLMACLGFGVFLWRWARGSEARLSRTQGAMVLWLGLAFVFQLAIVDYRIMESHSDGGTTHARFLFPVIVAISVWFALGFEGLGTVVAGKAGGFFTSHGVTRAPSFRTGAPSFFASGLLLATCLSAIGYAAYILPRHFVSLPVYGDSISAGVQHPTPSIFQKGMQLAGWSGTDKAQLKPGSTFTLRLFWQASSTPDFDYSAYVRLDNLHGMVIHDQDHAPGAEIGVLPRTWQPGEVIPDDWAVRIPANAPAGGYDIDVGVYDWQNMLQMRTSTGLNYATIGTVQITQ